MDAQQTQTAGPPPPPSVTTPLENPEIVPGIVRRSTAEALQQLSEAAARVTPRSRWYEPGKDFCFYSTAQDACRLSEAGLKKFKLNAEDRKIVEESKNLGFVTKKMESIMEAYDAEDSNTAKKVGRFVNGFCDFATKVSGFVKILLPQSPEYTITYGLIMIVFKAVVAKKEKQESLADFLDSLASKLPNIEFYESLYPTNQMKVTVAAIYVEIIAFLDHAARYYCTGRIGKLIDAMFEPVEKDFVMYYERVEIQMQRMNELTEVAHKAQQSDIKDTMDSVGQVLARFYVEHDSSMSAIASTLANLGNRVEKLQTHQDYITTFQAKSYIQMIRYAAFPDVIDADQELKGVITKGFRLSPKDHWENNGIIPNLINWSKAGRKPLLWVGGYSGTHDNWVTELSVDLIRALESQDKPVAFVFCQSNDQDEDDGNTNPLVLIKQLILQVLQIYPLLAFHNPELINERRLKKAETFEQLWQLWGDLTSQVGYIFLIIDRIDKCKPSDNVRVNAKMIQRFLAMLEASPNISMIITCNSDPPKELMEHAMIQRIWKDTSTPVRKRDERS